MDYEAIGNSCVRWGTWLVAGGAFFFSAGWFMLGICKQTNKSLKKSRWFKAAIWRVTVISFVVVFLLGLGSWMVGEGGSLTTKGWNEISKHDERQTLIRSAMRELEQNNKYLKDMDDCFTNLSTLEQV